MRSALRCVDRPRDGIEFELRDPREEARPNFAEPLFRLSAAHFTATASTLMLAECPAMLQQGEEQGQEGGQGGVGVEGAAGGAQGGARGEPARGVRITLGGVVLGIIKVKGPKGHP